MMMNIQRALTILSLLGTILLPVGSTYAKMRADTARYPQRPEDISPLLIGESIPKVQVVAADGKPFDLNMQVKVKPVILIFYRGGWCPYCNKALSGIQDIQEDLVKMGYQIIAISTDSPENLGKTADLQKLSYTLLSDADLGVAKKFGIAYRAPESYHAIIAAGSGGKNVAQLLPVPAVFILDQSGIIQFEYINPDFRQRISPELLLSAARVLRKDKAM
jgi:peroxiredoxin